MGVEHPIKDFIWRWPWASTSQRMHCENIDEDHQSKFSKRTMEDKGIQIKVLAQDMIPNGRVDIGLFQINASVR